MPTFGELREHDDRASTMIDPESIPR